MKENVQEYYGKVLQSSDDLQTNACCTDTAMPDYLKKAMAAIHDEVAMRYYGCGLVYPALIEGTRILDLGSGAGRDVFLLSKLVGEQGSIVGVDMTDEQLEVANKHIAYHTDLYGYSTPNVEFKKGYIEKLDELGLEDNSVDIIVSNCVINLSTDKEAVLREAYRLLKPGGELYFSDVYSSRRIPEELQADPVLYGECLSGALYWNDFENLAKFTGFSDPRLVEDRPLTINNQAIEDKVGEIKFFSATYRLFKLPKLEAACEDYGQAVRYKGSIPHCEQLFELDKHHSIETGKVFPVCGNTYRMLNESRFKEHFEFYGDWSTHYSIFAGCGTDMPFDGGAVLTDPESNGGGCC